MARFVPSHMQIFLPKYKGLVKPGISSTRLIQNPKLGECYKCNNTWPRGLLRLSCIASPGYKGAHSASPQRLTAPLL
eukprot:164652-Chlamydomonas_euryale.AAC.2